MPIDFKKTPDLDSSAVRLVYINDKPVLLVCDNSVFVKTITGIAELGPQRQAELGPQ